MTAAQSALIVGLDQLLAQLAESFSFTGGPTGGFRGLRAVRSRELPDGTGTIAEVSILCRRADLTTGVPVVGTILTGSDAATYRLLSVEPAEQPGTLRLRVDAAYA